MLWVDSSRTRDSRKAGRKWFSVFSPLHQDGHLDPPCQGQRVSLLGELGGSQPGHHQLRQHRPCHAHSLPVRHHGGLDPYPLLGAFFFIFSPIFILVLLMSVSLSRLSGRNQISCQWVSNQATIFRSNLNSSPSKSHRIIGGSYLTFQLCFCIWIFLRIFFDLSNLWVLYFHIFRVHFRKPGPTFCVR